MRRRKRENLPQWQASPASSSNYLCLFNEAERKAWKEKAVAYVNRWAFSQRRVTCPSEQRRA